ncbi:ABC transporter permease [Nonomuraea sp. NPDC050310]|uniref:ABC transporter permease n=1 Tax=Nonomuraea sp. NPDC050310 TaxID=3154935 RepID=UPI0033FD046C
MNGRDSTSGPEGIGGRGDGVRAAESRSLRTVPGATTRNRRRPVPARLRPRDVVRVAGAGLRARPMRVFLSALGIAIGIAAMLAVVGISTSSQEHLNRRLAALGTNLLTVAPGRSIFGEQSHLPSESLGMIGRIDGVTSVTATGTVPAKVYRHDRIPETESGGIAVMATRTDLLGTVGAKMADGVWLDAATSQYPAVVLGAEAADRLGIATAGPRTQVWLGGRWFTVVGILHPVPLVSSLDRTALIGWPVAESELGFDGYPTHVYTRTRDDAVTRVRDVLAATANPEHPEQVEISRPSDALAAKEAADETLTSLLLGLGGVALLVGGIGVANTMVISVLERRAEIGLRRSLGATRGQIRLQFLGESQLLSALGGAGGVLLGSLVVTLYASTQEWPTVIPLWASAGGLAATLLIGGVAGLYPAVRASRLSPTEALTAH